MSSYRYKHIDRSSAEDYEEKYLGDSAESFYWQMYEAPYLRKLFARLSNEVGSRHLDFACGTGRIVGVALEFFHNILAVDISEEMLSIAQEKYPNVTFCCIDVTRENVDVGEFDVASAFRFLLNAEPDLRYDALTWIHSVLRPGGIFVVNNHGNRWSIQGIKAMIANIALTKRHNTLSHEEMRRLLRQCGFEEIETYGFSFMPVVRKYLILPRAVLCVVEDFLVGRHALKKFSKDVIYVCRRR